jgi:hypothetical protein
MNVLLVIALLFLSNTYAFEFASFAETESIKADPYGKSLLETISLAMEKGGNIQEVQTLLDNLLFKLNKDQEDSDKAWVKENARLLAKIKKLTDEIEALRIEILKLKDERARYQILRDKVIANLKQYNKQRAADQAQARDLANKRVEDHNDFVKSQADHEAALNALDLVIAELKHLAGSVSGQGRPVDVAELSQEKRDGLYKSFLQITKNDEQAAAFLEVATQADQQALNKLISLLKKLKSSVEKSYNDDITAEAKSKRINEDLQATIKADIQKLTKMIVVSEKHLILYNKKIVQLTLEIESKTKIRNSKISERIATIKEREVKEAQYLADKAEREREMAVITKLQKIVKERLAKMSSYLKENVDA